MLRKHINDGATRVQVTGSKAIIGPCDCPQQGCQTRDGGGVYSKGLVVYEEYGGNSGTYTTSQPCKCCDGKGLLREGEKPYLRYCIATGIREVATGYPSPYPMSSEVYSDPKVVEAAKSKESTKTAATGSSTSDGCFLATEVYGDYHHPKVIQLRKFRDERLKSNLLGAGLVVVYYMLSPTVIALSRRCKWFARLVRWVLDGTNTKSVHK